uniref:WW domain-containing oxidoreductase n=1 Tax=Ascaris suum TaxID=6253 RepID=F1KZF6_ASCSU
MDESANTPAERIESDTEVKNLLNKEKDSSKTRRYGARSNALDVAAGVDLKGRTALVTGTNSGIGIETARTLCLCGAHVVMANRNIVESEKLINELKREKPDAEIDLLTVDLSSLQSINAAANEYLSKNWPLHILILNAAVFAPSEKSTIDGYERAFGVNYLGHFYLTYLLLPRIRESTPARIVIVSSTSHNHTGINAALPTEEKLKRLMPPVDGSTNVYRLYAYSKLCCVLLAMKLHRMEHSNGINSYVLHPGNMVATGISRTFGLLGRIGNALTKPFTKTLQQAAATTIYCAVSEDVKNDSGKYYEGCWDDEKNLCAALAHDEALQDALWDKSLELIEQYERSRTQQQ